MLSRITTIILGVGLLLGPNLTAESDATTSGFKVIVNESNPTTAMRAEELSRLFLSTSPEWTDGRQARPVDLTSDLPVRESFSTGVHGRNVTAIKSYWQKMIFSGKGAPPPELEAEGDVLRFLAANPSGVGYISSDTPLPAGIRVIQIH